nr:hypothetical protein [Tanacetum cinerariifolium]
MTLSSTLKASRNSLICYCGPPVVVVVVVIVVGVNGSISTISGYMASPLIVGAFGTTWSIMVEVAFRAQRFGSSLWFLFSRSCSIGPCNIVVPSEWLLVLLVPRIADVGHRFCSLKPSSQTNDSFSAIKHQRPAVQVVLVSALPSRAHCSGSCSSSMACISVDNTISLCFVFG